MNVCVHLYRTLQCPVLTDSGQLFFLMQAQCSVTPGLLVILIPTTLPSSSCVFVTFLSKTLVKKTEIFRDLAYISKSSLASCEIVSFANCSLIKLHLFFFFLGFITHSKQKGKKKTPTELTRETWTCFLPYNGSVCSLCSNIVQISWKSLLSLLYIYKRGNVEIPLTKSSKQSS